MTPVILALAVARLTRLITADSITEPAREWLLRRWPTDDTLFGDSEVEIDHGRHLLRTGVEVVRSRDGWIAVRPYRWSEVLTCYWCAAVWVGITVWLAYLAYPVTEMVLTPLALAYVASFLIGHE